MKIKEEDLENIFKKNKKVKIKFDCGKLGEKNYICFVIDCKDIYIQEKICNCDFHYEKHVSFLYDFYSEETGIKFETIEELKDFIMIKLNLVIKKYKTNIKDLKQELMKKKEIEKSLEEIYNLNQDPQKEIKKLSKILKNKK